MNVPRNKKKRCIHVKMWQKYGTWAIEVAVTLSDGGNQTAEMTRGPEPIWESFFLVFWTRTFMAFIFMIKHNVQFELFDFCMRFWKWNLGGTHHNIGNAVQYRADVTGESEELKGKWLFFVIGESEELKEKLLSFVTGKRESENIKKKVNLMQCESERCVNVVDVRGQAWCAAVIQSQLVDKR